MLKAIFMDFYGTAAYEISPIAIEVITKIYKSSNANSMEEITEYWWRTFRERLSHKTYGRTLAHYPDLR